MTAEKIGPVPFTSVLADMAWHPDHLVREIASEIDDREIEEIASAIHDLYFGGPNEGDGHEDLDDPMRAFAEPTETPMLPLERAQEATLLASRIIDWCNYGEAYGDLSDPPWEAAEDDDDETECSACGSDLERGRCYVCDGLSGIHSVTVRIDHRQPMSAMETARTQLAARFGMDAAFGFLSFSDETIDIPEDGMPIRERTFVFHRIK